MNQQDKQIVPYPKERSDAIKAIGDKLKVTTATLPPKYQKELRACIEALGIIKPRPAVSKVLGEFLVEMSNEQYRQDKVYGTDSDNENQLTAVVVRKKT